MKLLPLIWASLWRHPARAILMMMQIAAAFVLFGTLHGIDAAREIAINKQRADYLYVNPLVRADTLPIAYLPKIAAVPNVTIVNAQNFVVGTYRRPDERIVAIATDPAKYFTMNLDCFSNDPDCGLDRAQLATLLRTQAGAIVGRELADKYRWRIGDRISLRTRIPRRDGSPIWEFEIVGTYDYPGEPGAATLLVFNQRYLDESRADGKSGTVFRFTVQLNGADAVRATIESIDGLFANSAHETATVVEQEIARARFEDLGNLSFVAAAASLSALFALIFSIATMMMSSTQERAGELALLRALGFTTARLAGIEIVASLALFVPSAALGLAIAWRLILFARPYVGLVEMPVLVVVAGLVCSIVLALFCACLPLRYVLRTQPADVLVHA